MILTPAQATTFYVAIRHLINAGGTHLFAGLAADAGRRVDVIANAYGVTVRGCFTDGKGQTVREHYLDPHSFACAYGLHQEVAEC